MTERVGAAATSEASLDGPHAGAGSMKARSGLLARIAVGFGGLAIGLAIVFAVLIAAAIGLRHRSLEARHSQQVIATANGLQTLVIDFETGLRGFVITNQERYLEPWREARKRYPPQMTKLIRLTADDPSQQTVARAIKMSIDAYLRDYSLPLVEFMRRNPGAARDVVAAGRGARQVETIRQRFVRFLAAEEARSVSRDNRARRTAHNAVLIGGIALGVALLALLAAAVYLGRAVARPVRLV